MMTIAAAATLANCIILSSMRGLWAARATQLVFALSCAAQVSFYA
jgi:hypothetical protein